jgi:predicted  nucleic acid-binding Zn-ribbon protein
LNLTRDYEAEINLLAHEKNRLIDELEHLAKENEYLAKDKALLAGDLENENCNLRDLLL